MATIEEIQDKIADRQDYFHCNLLEDQDCLPCYLNRFSVIDEFDSLNKIKEYISAARKESHASCLFSVTTEDAYYKLWVDYAKAHPKTFTVFETRSIHGGYKVWAIMCKSLVK